MKQSKMAMRALILIVMALAAAAAFGQAAADFEYALNKAGDGVLITRYKGKAAQVSIPAQIEGMPVTEIGGAAFTSNTILTGVIIPEGVLAIQDGEYLRGAFGDCTKLASLTLPGTLKKIGSSAFSRCVSLSAVTIPAGVTEIGERAFYECSKLSSVTIPGGSIGLQAFYGCTALRSLTIAEAVSAIGAGAFYGCKALTAVRIPGTVKLDNGDGNGGAFQGCTALVSVELGEGLELIAGGMFSNCTALKEIRLPSTIKSIGDWAFSGCSSLAAVLIPDTVTAIRIFDKAFRGCPLNLTTQTALRKYRYTHREEDFRDWSMSG